MDEIADGQALGVAEGQGSDALTLVVQHDLEEEGLLARALELEDVAEGGALSPRELDLHDRSVHSGHSSAEARFARSAGLTRGLRLLWSRAPHANSTGGRQDATAAGLEPSLTPARS